MQNISIVYLKINGEKLGYISDNVKRFIKKLLEKNPSKRISACKK